MVTNKFTYIILFLVLPLFSLAQKYYSTNFTVNEGLPSNSINAIFKDSRGQLWIGTDAGLCNFDGKIFKVYSTSDGLVGNNIFSITEDKEGNLWLGCKGGGVSKFDGQKFSNLTEKNGLVSNAVRVVWYSKKFDLLFIGTNDGCSAFDGKKFFSYSAKQADARYHKLFITGFLDGKDFVNIYAFSLNEPIRYYPKQNRFQTSTVAISGNTDSSTSPLILENGDTIIGNGRKGIVVKNGKEPRYFNQIGQVFNLAKDELGNVWIAAWADEQDKKELFGGLYRYDGKKVERYSENIGITDRSVWSVYYDTTFHLLWVGTLNQGLFRIPAPVFTWYYADYFKVSNLLINDLLFHEGSLWLGTTGYIIRKYSDDTYKTIDLKNYTEEYLQGIKELLHDVFSYFFDKNGSFEKYNVLIKKGEYHYQNPYNAKMVDLDFSNILPPGSLYKPSEYKKTLQTWASLLKELTPHVYSIGSDSKGNILFGDQMGLRKLTKRTDFNTIEIIPTNSGAQKFIFDDADTLYHTDPNYRGIFRAAIYPHVQYPVNCWYGYEKQNGPPNVSSIISKNGEIWVGSKTEGLFRIFRGHIDAFNSQDSTLPKIINALCFDNNGNIIVGSNDGKVLIVHLGNQGKLQMLSKITSTDGFVGNVVRWLIVDKSNYLYAGTNLGLNRIDLNLLYKSKRICINFLDKYQGYFDCTGKTAALDDDGNIWVGTDSRLLKINTSLFQKIQSATQPIIYKVEVDNVPFTFKDRSTIPNWLPLIPNNYRFAYDQNSLTFYFKVVNYSDPENIYYRTKLKGLNNNWTAYGSDSKSVFTSLNPGKYKLKIEYYSHLDNSVIGTTEYNFSIASPLYRTWWFISLMSLIFITAIWLLYHFRVLDIRKQEKQKSDLQRDASNMEMKALQAQMKPHFIFNAINSIQSYIIDNDVDKALHYLSMFSKLIRKTLLNASKEFIPMEEELEYLKFYIEIEKMRFEGLFTYEQIIHPEISPEAILIPPMIVQPFVENAIKHGLIKKKENCKLLIEVSKVDDQHFKFIVQDNGVGRNQSNSDSDLPNLHQSKGMQIVAERLNLLNGTHQTNAYQMIIIDLVDEHGKPAGTRVEISFPLIEC